MGETRNAYRILVGTPLSQTVILKTEGTNRLDYDGPLENRNTGRRPVVITLI
jgi:hypothetical protein